MQKSMYEIGKHKQEGLDVVLSGELSCQLKF